MDHRTKMKVIKTFAEIVEEKRELLQALDRILNQVSLVVERVNNGGIIPHRGLKKLYYFQLKTLHKLSEFTGELELLNDEFPYKEVHEQSRDNNSHAIVVNQIYTDTNETKLSTPDGISEQDLLQIRETLRTSGQILGLNEQNISSIRNYYAKPSSCSIHFVDNQVSSSTPLPMVPYTSDPGSYEIPEKDGSPGVFVDSPQDISINRQIHDVAFPIRDNREIDPHSFRENCNIDNTAVNYIQGTSDPTLHYVSINSYNDDAICLQNSNMPCTAIEKLNNLKLSEKKNSNAVIQPMELPDISLKATGIKDPAETIPQNTNVIKNIQTTKKKNNNLNNPGFIELKPKTVPDVGTTCVFSHIESPSHFYIHLVDEESIVIDNISEIIKNYAESIKLKYKSRDEANNDIKKYGVAFIAQFSSWYRIEVLDWYREYEHGNVFVRLVDYGSTHIVSYKNLRKMPADLASVPMLGVRCHFPVMYPPNSTAVNILREWPQDSICAFMELSGLLGQYETEENFFQITYAFNDPDLKSVAIDLFHVDRGSEYLTVGQVLLDLGLAVQITDEYDEQETELGVFLQDVDTLEAASNVNEAVAGYDARDEVRICRFTRLDGTCFKGKNCKLEHVPLSKYGFTTDRDIVFREAMYALLLPKIGELVMVLITGYRDICNFFVQIIRKPHIERNYTVDEDFHLLLQNINSPKVVNTYEQFKVAPGIGEIVLFKHWSSQWIRGVVRNFDTNEDGEPFNFQVYAVDYGENLKVNSKDLRKIKPHHLQLPFQAVESFIHDHKLKNGHPPRDAKQFFDKNLYFHNFLATVMSSSLPLKINLQTMNGVLNIGKSLEQKGYAEKRTFDINPSDDCGLAIQ